MPRSSRRWRMRRFVMETQVVGRFCMRLRPVPVCRVTAWASMVGELVFLDCMLLPSWLTMFAVIRKGERT